MEFEARLARLEADRAIRDLKMRYLRAADGKDPDAMRACFRSDARVRFDGFPPFDDRDSFVDMYRQFGCAPGIFDIHQGGTGIIEFDSDTRARGGWPVYFHNINLAERSLTQLGVEYQDVYVLEDRRWWIAESVSTRKSCLIHTVDEDGVAKVAAMGAAPDSFI